MENFFDHLCAQYRKENEPRLRAENVNSDEVVLFRDFIKNWFQKNPPVGVTQGDAGAGLALRFADGSSYALFATKEDSAQFQSVSVVGTIGHSRLPSGKSIPITR